jgi:hypothetical protein
MPAQALACFSTTVDGLVNFLRRQLDKKEDIINKQANEIAELVNGKERADEIARLLDLLIESACDEDGYQKKAKESRKAWTEGETEDTQDGGFDGI